MVTLRVTAIRREIVSITASRVPFLHGTAALCSSEAKSEETLSSAASSAVNLSRSLS